MEQAGAAALYRGNLSPDQKVWTRPVITNDGWEHTVSDIITLHDYTQGGESLKDRLAHKDEILSDLPSPYAARPAFAKGYAYYGQPVIVSEYGGLAIIQDDPAYGFGCKVERQDFLPRLESITAALRQTPYLCGYCYTQLTDVQQEINGHMDMQRRCKTDAKAIRAINLK